MAKKTIREIILSVKAGKTKSISTDKIDVDGYRQDAYRISKKAKEEGVAVPGDKPLYTISVNKRIGKMFIINNMK